MPLRHVRDLVREHRRELRFALREQDEAGVDADIAARQRERVDGRIGHGEELEVLPALGNGGDEAVPELVQVVVDFGILEIGAGGADLPDDRFADPAFLPRGERRLRFLAEIGQGLRLRGARREGRRRHGLRGQRDRHQRGDRRPALRRRGRWSSGVGRGVMGSGKRRTAMLRCAASPEVQAEEAAWQAGEARRQDPRRNRAGRPVGGRAVARAPAKALILRISTRPVRRTWWMWPRKM